MKKFKRYSLLLCVCMLLSIFSAPLSSAIDITCEGAYLVDSVTDTVLYEKNADKKMYPAGLTKIMTAILVLENGTLDEMVTISKDAISHGASSGGYLKFKEGEQLSVLDLLYCLLLVSSNEAAYALAEHIAGDTQTFVNMMNSKAAQLGAVHTQFKNPSGLPDDNHYTTPKDMYLISAYAAKNVQFMDISNSVERRISPTNMNNKGYVFYTDNHLISKFKNANYVYKYARGILGGYTSKSGYCLVSTATQQKDGPTLIGVVMNGQRASTKDKIPSFVDMANLFEDAFSRYGIVQILKSGEMLGETNIALGKTKDFISVSAGENISVLLPKNADLSKVEKKLKFNPDIKAPIAKGDVMGTVDIIYDGKIYATSKLLATFDVEKSEFLQFIHSISTFLRSGYVKVGGVLLAAFIILYVVMTILANRRRQMMLNSHRKRRKKF